MVKKIYYTYILSSDVRSSDLTYFLIHLSFVEFCLFVTTDYGHPVRKSPSLHGRKSTPSPRFLGTAAAYLVCHIGPKFSDFFDLCLHWVSVVRVLQPSVGAFLWVWLVGGGPYGP